MAKGYYLVLGDKTTCGGMIIGGDTTYTLLGKPVAREQEQVTCGKYPGIFIIVGHIPCDSAKSRKFAGTLHSKSSCPCQSRLIPSILTNTYERGAAASDVVEQSITPNPAGEVFSPSDTDSRKRGGNTPTNPVEDDTEFQIRLAEAMLAANQYTLMDTSEPPVTVTPPGTPVPLETNQKAVTAADRKPYLELEKQYQALFENPYIQRLSEEEEVNFKGVEDVDMDETKVINAARGKNFIGTTGLGPCIAVCAYGRTYSNELILGLSHYSGVMEPEEILSEVDEEMRDAGASNIEFYLVGGMIVPGGSDSGTLETERRLLSLKDNFNIKGARLHVSEGREEAPGEERINSDEAESVDVVVTTEKIYFRRKAMYS